MLKEMEDKVAVNGFASKCVLFALVGYIFTSFCGIGSVCALPSGFVDVKDVAPSVVLDMRYSGPHNFVGSKIDGYNSSRCILTRKTAEALAKVQRELETFGLSLKIYDCYRPQRAVDHFCRWAEALDDTKMKKEFYPTVEKSNLFSDGYIARKSGHSRGSACDLTVVALPLRAQARFTPGQQLSECFLAESKRFQDNSIDLGTGLVMAYNPCKRG